MDFLTGLTNLTNWMGNVIMPTLAGLFFVIAVLRFARGVPFQYSMYAGLAALLISGILRAIETFSQQRAWNDPDAVWVTLLGLVNWSANVILPLYGALQVLIAVLHYGGAGFRLYPGTLWGRHIVAAMCCFGLSGLLRLAEFFVEQGAGGLS
ncbi:MAG: hypothetical protein KIT09_15990 [Bryobacteraceae bacterium]|nr:hypothetical protein [Bryobacteraceae bacterium]